MSPPDRRCSGGCPRVEGRCPSKSLGIYQLQSGPQRRLVVKLVRKLSPGSRGHDTHVLGIDSSAHVSSAVLYCGCYAMDTRVTDINEYVRMAQPLGTANGSPGDVLLACISRGHAFTTSANKMSFVGTSSARTVNLRSWACLPARRQRGVGSLSTNNSVRPTSRDSTASTWATSSAVHQPRQRR